MTGSENKKKSAMVESGPISFPMPASSRVEGLAWWPKGRMNTKLHAVTYANGRPISFFLTAGQASDCTGTGALLDSLPRAQWLLGDRG